MSLTANSPIMNLTSSQIEKLTSKALKISHERTNVLNKLREALIKEDIEKIVHYALLLTGLNHEDNER